MAWILATLILVAVGAALRRLLRLDRDLSGGAKGLAPLDEERQAVYQAIALEVETQAAILGISLNDAYEERDSGHSKIAWRLVQFSVGEWNRLAELIRGLVKVIGRHLSAAQEVVPIRGMVAHRFKSPTMVNYARMHELLEQLVFGSSLRFQIHLRVLRRAAETLTSDFRRLCRAEDGTDSRAEEFWKQLDLYFHDFDLVAKEGLLALRALLLCLPPSALVEIASDVKLAVGRGVRSPITTVVERHS